MKRIIIVLLVIFISGTVIGLFLDESGKLSASKSMTKQMDDFLLHMRVEEADKGIRVLHSLQYVGEEPVEISHQTPLVSASLQERNHDFTGEPVNKEMKQDMIYYQDEIYLQAPEKGESDLYILAKFDVAGEEISIEHVEPLRFQ